MAVWGDTMSETPTTGWMTPDVRPHWSGKGFIAIITHIDHTKKMNLTEFAGEGATEQEASGRATKALSKYRAMFNV